MKKITKVWVEKIPDYDTDLSYLGTFSDTKGKFAIQHDNPSTRQSYKYFNADNVENMKQARQNYDRIMEYENGNVIDYGVKAFAEIQTTIAMVEPANYWLQNTISSGGVWGLASDGDKSEFDNEAENQLDELADVLRELGFSEDQVSEAGVEYKNW